MSRVPVKYAALHSPHFHLLGEKSAVNVGDKLDTRLRKNMKIEWDEDVKKMYITIDGQEMTLPENNFKTWAYGTFTPPVVAAEIIPHTPRHTAQVSTPQNHVFAGAGHGKTGK